MHKFLNHAFIVALFVKVAVFTLAVIPSRNETSNKFESNSAALSVCVTKVKYSWQFS